MSGFVIAPLSLRHGTVALSPLPALPQDRTAVEAFGPALVVSMTETAEMATLGAGDLPEWLAARGIGWAHFPVADFGIPPRNADWPALSGRIAALLDGGEKVLLHCRGGLGRSGMVALRLMVDAGEDPCTALMRLRAARPGAVETAAQFDWAARQAP